MKSRNKIIALILLGIFGLGILLYPSIANYWNERRAAMLITHYEEISAQVDDSAKQEELAKIREYNKGLIGSIVPDAFAENEHEVDPVYVSLLNINGDGMMGTVEIPSIKVTLPIYHYTDQETLQKGAGHLAGSSLPVGGKGTHCTISAHRGLPNAKLFTDLDRLKKGNVFYLHVLGDTLAYEVDQIKTVEPEETEDLAITAETDYCTLFTCTPYGVNTHRLLVRGHRVEYRQAVYEHENETTLAPSRNTVLIRAVCVLIGIVIAAAVVFIIDRVKRRKVLFLQEKNGLSNQTDDEKER
ncbi:MAG: class C sortase [Oscillospiraceae bacterium]|nr:class C sortase [Oscillospiraceae bacterium]